MADRTERELMKVQVAARGAVSAAVVRLGADHTKDPDAAIDRFGERMIDFLELAHTRAAYLGRYRAGDTAPTDSDDRAFAAQVVEGEDSFLARFEEAIREGRYTNEDGTLRLGAIRARAGLYVQRVRGTANEAWALATPGGIAWVVDASAENCEDCLRYAAEGPYIWETLPSYPRAGLTRCITACRCVLRDEGGKTSFR